MQKYISLLVLSFLSAAGFTQEITTGRNYPDTDFRSPLGIPPALSSSFGEIRSNHLHSGLDYRTNQREGYPVYAVADGFISRLRVQIAGFGNAVYINHPNGYTSVYAHLQRFNSRIAKTIKDYQYANQLNNVDFPLLSSDIPVKKGEVIAWSGNTGGSAGPHLHFEIRDSKTEETINPQLFGINIPDKIKPIIKGIYAYRLGDQPFSEKTTKQYFQAVASNGKYVLNTTNPININAETGFGIRTDDQIGIYSIELKIDQKTIYLSALERFYFDHTQAANSYIDYPAFLNSGLIILKTFVEPGNPLTIYKTAVNNAVIQPTDQEVHNMEYIIKDVKGNTSILAFKVKFNAENNLSSRGTTGVKKFIYNQLNEFSADNVKLFIPKGALYSDLNFTYSQSKKSAGTYSAVHQIHTRIIPLNSPYDLWISPDSSLAPGLRDKALIRDTRGKAYASVFENGYIKATPATFGSFYITLDTVAPVIRPVNITEGKSMAGTNKVIFKISDALSGIKSFKGTIDGKWVLMEYDQKTATLWHTFDEQTTSGKHVFQLDVTDNKLNTKTYSSTFYR